MVRPVEIVIENALLVVTSAASATVTVKLNRLAPAGVPLIVLVVALPAKFSPGGKPPAVMDQLYGGVPPVAEMV